MKTFAAAFLTVFAVSAPAFAAADKFHVTKAERAACEPDAASLCADVAQDEDQLLACMKTNTAKLTPGCRTVFIAGLRSRHLN